MQISHRLAMSSYILTCRNAACARPFQVNRFEHLQAANFNSSFIECPHCGETGNPHPGVVFVSHSTALDDVLHTPLLLARRNRSQSA